jgi:hypothetical protein
VALAGGDVQRRQAILGAFTSKSLEKVGLEAWKMIFSEFHGGDFMFCVPVLVGSMLSLTTIIATADPICQRSICIALVQIHSGRQQAQQATQMSLTGSQPALDLSKGPRNMAMR